MEPRQTPTTSQCPRTGRGDLSGDRGDLPEDSSSDYIRSHVFSVLLMSIHAIVQQVTCKDNDTIYATNYSLILGKICQGISVKRGLSFYLHGCWPEDEHLQTFDQN